VSIHEPRPPLDPHRARPSRSPLARALWAVLGLAFVAVGAVGVIVPGLPTTPFLLLAAACFLRSSQRLYDRLLANRVCGPLVRDFRDGKGVPRRAKVLSIATMWIFVAFAVLVAIGPERWVARLAVLLAAGLGTLYLLRLPTRRDI
jgi:uncharacterized membrane protein YbaN (DUF454 family)